VRGGGKGEKEGQGHVRGLLIFSKIMIGGNLPPAVLAGGGGWPAPDKEKKTKTHERKKGFLGLRSEGEMLVPFRKKGKEGGGDQREKKKVCSPKPRATKGPIQALLN